MKIGNWIVAGIFAAVAVMSSVAAWKDASFVARGGEIKGGYDDGKWFVADSFSFGVEREMKESGEGATGGPGNLTMTFAKGFEGRDALYAYYESGEPIKQMTLTTQNADGTYLKYKLDRCFIKSWSTSGDADDRPTEEVAFYYNKIAFAYAKTKDGKRSKGADVETLQQQENRN